MPLYQPCLRKTEQGYRDAIGHICDVMELRTSVVSSVMMASLCYLLTPSFVCRHGVSVLAPSAQGGTDPDETLCKPANLHELSPL